MSAAPDLFTRWDERVPAHRARDLERLIPLAVELADRAGPLGMTVADLRLAAVQRGILTGEERGRALSFLGAVLTKAGLAKTGGYRRSVIARSHGNIHAVFCAPRHARAA